MQIIGRSSPFLQNVVSSGLDSVTEGIVQSTRNNGTAALDTAISNFSTADPNAATNFDRQQVSAVAEFPDPTSFLKDQGKRDEVLNALNQPNFRLADELSAVSNNISGMSPNFKELQQIDFLRPQVETLKDMQSTVERLSDLQQSADLHRFAQGSQPTGRPSFAPNMSAALQAKNDAAQRFAETSQQEAATQDEAKGLGANVAANTSLGPSAHAVADADIGKNTYLQLGAGAFEGAKAEVTGTAELGDYGSISATGSGYLGVGANADLDVGLKDGKFSFKFGGGVALGLGAGIDFGFDINFKKIGETLWDAGSDAIDTAKDAAETVGEAAGDAADAVGDAAGDAADAIGDAAQDVADTLGDAANAVGGAVSDVLDW